jgi:hypothetical protein
VKRQIKKFLCVNHPFFINYGSYFANLTWCKFDLVTLDLAWYEELLLEINLKIYQERQEQD